VLFIGQIAYPQLVAAAAFSDAIRASHANLAQHTRRCSLYQPRCDSTTIRRNQRNAASRTSIKSSFTMDVVVKEEAPSDNLPQFILWQLNKLLGNSASTPHRFGPSAL